MSFNLKAAVRARFWKQAADNPNSLPPLPDYAGDNNYQSYALNSAGTGSAPTFKELNSSNQFEINAGHTIIGGSLTMAQIVPPGNPTATVNGTAGTTHYSWNIVARSGNLSVPAATAVAVTTGAATLTGTNSVTISWVPSTVNVQIYDVYRTASAGTPATTGRIGTHIGAFALSNTGTMTFTDTGLVADGSTIPATNTSGSMTGDLNLYGNLNLIALLTPATPIATVNGTSGASTNAYKVVAYCGPTLTPTGHTIASSAVSVTTCNATLSSTNSVTLTWQSVIGATSYGVYRTTAGGTSPTTTGLIGTTTSSTFTDTGLAGDSSSAPVTNTTGVSSLPNSTTAALAAITDINGNPEIIFTATASAVNGLTETNSAIGNPVVLATSGSDTNIGFTINSKGTGAITLAPLAAGGTIVIGKTDQTGAITVGSSSGTEVVNVGTGAGISTVNLATVSIAGANLNVATAATGAGITDTVAISTGNAAATGIKVVNIATGTPGTSGNNRVTVGGGTTSAVTINAALTQYQAPNYIASETGANNAIVGALLNASGAAVATTPVAGLRFSIKLSHSLQAGANTLALNGGSATAIKGHRNPANDIGTAYVSGGIVDLMGDGTAYLDMSQ